ncbi:MAG TPA: indole-3-glycerol phosphate synthase TrpC [Pyrinomonadaceae bacterium]
MKTTLDIIVDATRARVMDARRTTDMDVLFKRAQAAQVEVPPNRLRQALMSPDTVNIIAEFKRASPSKGVINDRVDPTAVAQSYEAGGACAISVLTEPDFFLGSLEDLRSVRRAVSLPILRKDFIIDELQIFEAAEAGADAILLIVTVLQRDELLHMQSVAHKLGLDALVEVHTLNELEIAKDIDATLIGVNNRDLKSLEVSLDVSRELIPHAPPNVPMIAESGLKSGDDLIGLRQLGYSGFLIGETLMQSGDPASSLRGLVGNSAS